MELTARRFAVYSSSANCVDRGSQGSADVKITRGKYSMSSGVGNVDSKPDITPLSDNGITNLSPASVSA